MGSSTFHLASPPTPPATSTSWTRTTTACRSSPAPAPTSPNGARPAAATGSSSFHISSPPTPPATSTSRTRATTASRSSAAPAPTSPSGAPWAAARGSSTLLGASPRTPPATSTSRTTTTASRSSSRRPGSRWSRTSATTRGARCRFASSGPLATPRDPVRRSPGTRSIAGSIRCPVRARTWMNPGSAPTRIRPRRKVHSSPAGPTFSPYQRTARASTTPWSPR